MTTTDSFKEELNTLSSNYNLSDYRKFNPFRVMYKLTEEKNLHSRFIAFMLDPKGSHGQGTEFLKEFLKEFGLPELDLEGVEVFPNERNREEKHNIDILITNSRNQTIIIENKIFAGDSNKDDLVIDVTDPENQFRKYQLPRYYDIITKQVKREVVGMLYLTIDGKYPSLYDDFPKEVDWDNLLIRKEYLTHIQHWLKTCLDRLKKENDVRRFIEQYSDAIKYFLNDVKLVVELKNLSAKHLSEAYEFWCGKDETKIEGVANAQEVLNQFIHVKWHTVHEFYTLLREKISKEFKVVVSEVDNEKITSLTHRDSKGRAIISFTKNDILYYVCNDAKGFTIGRHIEPKKDDDYKPLFDKKYAYFDFSKDEVFELIDSKKSEELVMEIVGQLKEFINKKRT